MNIALLCKTEIHIENVVKGLKPWPIAVCRSRNELQMAILNADVLIALNQGFHFHTVDEEILATAKNLRLIQHYGVSWDATDAVAARKLGINVATQPGMNSRSVAEQTLFLMLALSRRMHIGQRLLHERRMGEAPCVELEHKTLCIVGLGIIGKMLVKYGQGLGMKVIGVRKNPSNIDIDDLGVSKVYGIDQLHEALKAADFTILLLPLTKDTHDMIDAAAFKMMKPTSMLINMSRGPHVNRRDLENALRNNQIAGYASDVYWTEPADPDDPLLRDERVIITPHLGGSSVECIQRTVDGIRANLLRFEKGEPLQNVVN